MSSHVCFTCGLSVSAWRGGWKHASGRHNGRTPTRKQHAPVPVPRGEYERFVAVDTPLDEARAIASKYRSRGT